MAEAMARRLAGVAALAAAVVLVLAASGCAAVDFYVGGRDGWTARPAEPFNQWAERNRFQVDDRLVFRYSKGQDSVLVVSQSHYDACNATAPSVRFDDGDSVFVLKRSGPFFFISGDAGRCQAGERLIVVVLAVRNNTALAPPPTPPAPGTNWTASPPPVPAPAPRWTPPPAAGNSTAPAPAPATNGTASPPPPSSASALGGGFLLLSIVIGGAIALV